MESNWNFRKQGIGKEMKLRRTLISHKPKTKPTKKSHFKFEWDFFNLEIDNLH
jgi:hypothetical protein